MARNGECEEGLSGLSSEKVAMQPMSFPTRVMLVLALGEVSSFSKP